MIKFVITRTREWGEQPCVEVAQETYIKMDVRTTDDPAKIEFYKGETAWWYEEGSNHRVERKQVSCLYDDPVTRWENCIVRDIGIEQRYFLLIPTLEDLMEFQAKYGRLIIGRTWDHKDELPTIEIYDGNK